MANFYIAVTVEQDRNERHLLLRENPEYSPGYYAYVTKCTDSDNLKAVLNMIGGLVHANIFPTKKKAAEAVQLWNGSYKANGTYLFSSPAF